MLAVLNQVLTDEELAKLRGLMADEALFEDGKATAGFRAGRVKNNLQVKKDAAGLPEARSLVLTALQRHANFQIATFVRSIRPILFSRYKPGMQYGLHVDNPLMGKDKKDRTDIAMTLFLSDPGSYDGGELYFESPWGAQSVKLPAGSAVLYPASTLHRVNPVTRGERLAAVTWIQSYIRDPAKREILAELSRVRAFLNQQAPGAPETDLAFKALSNLVRLWAEP